MEESDTQFHLRLPKDVHGKIKQRAKMNGRSLNAEITLIIEESLAQPPRISGFRDDAEREADILAQEVQKLVFELASEHYRKK
ncbi:Arc family DNA-binding protein [Klebsiella pneumoniae]